MVDYDYFKLGWETIELHVDMSPVEVLKTLEVMQEVTMHNDGGGLEDDTKFGCNHDQDAVIPYLDSGIYSDTNPDIIGTYYIQEIIEALERLGHVKVSDEPDRLVLGRIFNDE